MATPYHRLARETPVYAWWKLPVAALAITAIYVGLTIVLVGAAAAWFAVTDSASSVEGWLDAAGDLDLARPEYFALDLSGLVLLIPAVLLGVLATGPRPVGYLSSVTGRLRWRWLARTTVMAFAISGVTIGGWVAVAAVTDPAEVSAPAAIDRQIVTALLLIVLLVPFQAAAEEYLFRGYLIQLVGSWSRFAIIPLLVTTPLFVAGHGYGVWGLVDVALFGLTAGVLTIRTGGLEAAIAAHVANNVLLFVLDAIGMISATDDSGVRPVDVIPTVLSCGLLIVLVERAARRSGIQRTREPLPGPQAPMWPPPPYAMPVYAPNDTVMAGPPATSVSLHPDTPDYPGELPPGWGQ